MNLLLMKDSKCRIAEENNSIIVTHACACVCDMDQPAYYYSNAFKLFHAN
jgi:hypothetical protein